MRLGMSKPHSLHGKGCKLGNSFIVYTLHMLLTFHKDYYYFTSNIKDFRVSLSKNVEGSVELNQNMLCIYRSSNVFNSAITEYTNLQF